MIYFDNAATSYPKPKGMIMEMENCIINYCGNPGRSGHFMSTRTGEQIYQSRKKLSRFLGIEKPERLIFTKNTTEALNIALRGLLKSGDHVITTSMEHNSVLRPLKCLEKNNVETTIVKGDDNGVINPANIKENIRENTRLIIITGATNTTGTIMPIKEVGLIAQENHIIYALDGAQIIGHENIDIDNLQIDVLAFPGHKGLLGPQGTGGLYVREGLQLNPLIYGGTGTDSKNVIQPLDFPDGYESGTLNSPGIIGLGYSIEFLMRVGVETIRFQEMQLIKRLDEALKNMNKIKVYGPESSMKSGITLFNIEGITGEEVTEILNSKYGIAVRGGFHCAGLAHKTIGTWDTGAVRVSVGPFNTIKEIDALKDAINKISKL